MKTEICNQRSFSLSNATDMLNDMAEFAIRSRYSDRHIRLFFDECTDESHTGYDKSVRSNRPRSNPFLYCQIGILEVYENMDDHGMVRDVDLVWAGKHIFHEASHIHDMLIGYQVKNPSLDVLDAARMDAVSVAFCGYHQSTYAYMPSELKADIRGFEGVVSWFDACFDGEIDARSCLVERVRELSVWRGDRNAPDYDSMVQSIKDRLSAQEYRYRSRNMILDREDQRNPYKMEVCRKWSDVIDSVDRVGIEYDQKLFAVAMDMNSGWIDRFACLDDEVERVRAMYPSRRSLFGRLEGYMDRRQNMKDMPDTELPFWVQKVLREADVMEMRQDGKDDWQLGGWKMIFDKRELERLGIHPEPDEFVLVVDAARYASSGSDGDFEFEIGMFEGGAFHAVSDMDVVLNHRYPNSAYETATGRFGRKLCRCGCPFVLKRDLLKKQLYFFLHSGFRVQGADAVVCALDFEPVDSPDGLMYGFSVKAFPPGRRGGDNGDVSFTLLSGQGTGAWRMTEYGFRSSSDSRFDHVLFDAGRCRRYTGSSGCVCLEPAEHLKLPAFAMDMGLLFV